ncbi:hypothetical protein J3L16_08510 [Alteromonas sp. 5E99-2]|uniref:hypothetical protein n=1 Tax=Alteromonas sp. 5E99-2 TaxID=2817683 RepID=UPI001A980D8F|nr:hypothetical protein [Alteromonas sp. 5E99-2]MBO1255724.1 hypothetical protein [Alteromonas sp. 5E99-2]
MLSTDVKSTNVNTVKGNSALDYIAFEWSSALADSAGDSKLFNLYLAMHESLCKVAPKIRENGHDEKSLEDKLNALNHYRRARFSYSSEAEQNSLIQSNLRSEGEQTAAWLQECLHPLPLHYKDDANHIEQSIKTNCALSTQWGLAEEVDEDAIHLPLDTDATLLVDVVEASQAML